MNGKQFQNKSWIVWFLMMLIVGAIVASCSQKTNPTLITESLYVPPQPTTGPVKDFHIVVSSLFDADSMTEGSQPGNMWSLFNDTNTQFEKAELVRLSDGVILGVFSPTQMQSSIVGEMTLDQKQGTFLRLSNGSQTNICVWFLTTDADGLIYLCEGYSVILPTPTP